MPRNVRDKSVIDHSRSIKKTLMEIDKILDGVKLPKEGPLRTELRNKIADAFDKVGQRWYKKGFNRGHVEAYRGNLEKGAVPKKLKADMVRQFTPAGEEITVKLRSRIKE